MLFFPFGNAHAQSVIRDTEIENAFREWMEPLLKAANMGGQSVSLVLVGSPQVNAFVAGGANIFVYTGLILKSESPEEIIGVLAHELGHITGGHLIGGRDAMERASYESILGTFLGVGAAILSGDGRAAAAVSAGASNIATRRFLAHSRVNESAADQAALTLLEKSDITPEGLRSFMQKLASEELLSPNDQSEYVRTHPISANRVDAMERKIEQSNAKFTPVPQRWIEQHERMKAKLLGYMKPGHVVWSYNDSDTSIPAVYARSIAAYRQNKFDNALQGIDDLISREPDNPYIYELKGDVLLSAGRVEEAAAELERAVKIAPHASLIRIQLGKALLQVKNPDEAHVQRAIDILQRALIDEPRSGAAYRMLATAYGKIGIENTAKLYLAEEAVLQRKYPYAKTLLQGIIGSFEEGSKNQIKAQDLLNHVENLARKS